MNWPYRLLDLTHAQKLERRELLNRYGTYAQLSALIPILAYQLYRLLTWVYSERQRAKPGYSEVPGSPITKHRRNSTSGSLIKQWRVTQWWLASEVVPGWGSNGQWIAAGSWTAWLLFLCVHQTGDDYLHVTKRFGHIAASQFPLHYMLSMKSLYSPLAIAFQASHEELNPWHRMSGRIIYFLLLNHVANYINVFLLFGVFWKRLSESIIIIGILAFAMFTLMTSTSLASVRHWNYRLFFILHLVIGVTVLPLLFFHVSQLRVYVFEAFALFIVDQVCRKLDTLTGFATISKIPNTKLIKLQIPLPRSKLGRFRAKPAQHVYLSLPPESTPPGTSKLSIHELLANPFTVADVSRTSITLVLRTLHGPTTKALNTLTALTKARPPIRIEGPYGSSQTFPNFAAKYDRILLVAGGVGSTFIIPIYRALKDELETEDRSPDSVKLIWSMRSSSEAAWLATPDSGVKLQDESNVTIHLTRGTLSDREHAEPADGSVELDELNPEQEVVLDGVHARPDLKKIVDDTFRMGSEERVAVLVCGPKGMAKELRHHVGRWAMAGRQIFWHDESFGL